MAILEPRSWRSSSSLIVVMSRPLKQDRARHDRAVLAQIAHDGERHGRLAAAGLADDAHGLARHDREVEVDHGRDLALAREIGDARDSRTPGSACAFRPWPQSFSEISRRPSASRLKPEHQRGDGERRDQHGMHARTTPNSARPPRSSGPSPGSGGGRPRPRKPRSGDGDRGVAEPQAGIDDQRPARIGQQLDQHDAQGDSPRVWAAKM